MWQRILVEPEAKVSISRYFISWQGPRNCAQSYKLHGPGDQCKDAAGSTLRFSYDF